jgi:hypothetical protein
MGERRGVYRILVGKHTGKDYLEDQGAEGRIMDLPEVGLGGMELIDLAQDRDTCRALVNAVMNLQVP